MFPVSYSFECTLQLIIYCISLLRVLDRVCSQTCSSFGSTVCPPAQRPVAESSNTELNGEQALSARTQRQLVIPGGPMNVSFPPMGQFLFPPSVTHASNENSREGFGFDPNMPSSQLEAERKLLQCQIEVELH